MKKWIAVIMLIALCESLFSQEEKTLKCNFKYEVVSTGQTSKLKLICLVPQDIDNVQKINSINYSIQPDNIFYKSGNKYVQFILDNLSHKTEIVISVVLRLFVNDLSTNIENKKALNDTLVNFLNSEKYIEKDNKKITKTALKLQANTQEKTVQKIYTFVNQKIEYTGYNPTDIGATKALSTKQGDCTEFSDLFVALCRANNIPARVVEGMVTDYKNTAKHIWTEVYFDKYGWIRFDPTPGNSSTFKRMENKYIQLSIVRNDEILNNYHYWVYWYWGAPVEIKEYIEIENE